jgi:hypothetical protein
MEAVEDEAAISTLTAKLEADPRRKRWEHLPLPREVITGRVAHELQNGNMFWFNWFTEFLHYPSWLDIVSVALQRWLKSLTTWDSRRSLPSPIIPDKG